MKKIDRLLLLGFIPPFIMTFFVAIFVLIMQFLWQYIDEIIGKGVGIAFILELLFYRSTALVPMALPIAMLISSVMVMGNLGERYELAAMKSAGIPLLRVMAVLIVLGVFIGFGSFLAANYLIPYSNLKFKSRLYDIRKQKPTLSLSEGTFNNDLTGFVIRIGKKEKDEKTLHDVMIYDHSQNRVNDKLVFARDGEMTYSTNKRYLVMKLANGYSAEDVAGTGARSLSYPFMRTHFKNYEIIFDMEQFTFKKTDEDLFKSHQSMLNAGQLLLAIDSIKKNEATRIKQLSDFTAPYFYFHNSTFGNRHYKPVTLNHTPTSLLALFPDSTRKTVVNRALTNVHNVADYINGAQEDVKVMENNIRDHYIEYYKKYSMALACFLFLFIGAPMGAIIRKGGFGYPILVSIVFFVMYIMVSISGEKLAKEGSFSPELGMFLPVMVLLPIGFFLTLRAMQDAKLMDVSGYVALLSGVWEKIKTLRAAKPTA